MQYLAVLFSGADPTKGSYNQLPITVMEIDSPDMLPNDGSTWVLMTIPSLNDYIERVRLKAEPIEDPVQAAERRVRSSKEFGLSLIDQAAAENIALGLNSAQVMAMLTKMAPVISMLMTGSLSSALIVLQHTAPDAVVTQDRLNAYINQIQNFLRTLQ